MKAFFRKIGRIKKRKAIKKQWRQLLVDGHLNMIQ